MKKITFLFTFSFSILFCNLFFAQTFDWETAVDNGTTVSQTVSTITATVSTSNNDVDFVNAGNVNGTSGNVVFGNTTNGSTSATITFSTAVNVATIAALDSELSGGNTWTFAPSGGSNASLAIAITGNVTTVSLNWTGVTAITVTSAAPGGLESFGFDDIVLGSATVAPTIVSFAATPITTTEATLYGNVTTNGGDAITERGFVYSLTSADATPTVGESSGTNVTKVVVSGTTGAFNQMIPSLADASEYSFAAYAINSTGTSESIVQTFTTLDGSSASNCMVTNPYDTSNTNVSNAHLGQSFVACKTGILQSIALLVTFDETSTGETINVYSGTTVHPSNLQGSVIGQTFTENGGDPNNLDVTDFSGQAINVVSGQVYTFDIPTTANLVYTNDNGYTTGDLFFNGSANGGNFDLIFDVVIASAADVIPPIFENSTPDASSIAGTTLTLNTDIDEAGDIFYVVVPDGASAPTSAEVVAGTGSGGSGQVASGNAAVSGGSFVNNFNVTGLTSETAYDIYVVAQDNEGSPNLQTSPTLVNVTTADITAPTYVVNPFPPTINATSILMGLGISEQGTAYYVVLTDGATVPTAAEVKAGTGSGGAAVVTSDNILITDSGGGNFSHSFDVTSLSENTAYDIYVIAEDAAGNLQTTPFLLEITTLDVTNPILNSASPSDGASGVSTSSNIVLTFNENIAFGTGNIEVIDVTDASNSFTINAAAPGSQASISGAVLTINPSSNLDDSSNYVIQIAMTAIDDTSGNSYAGITDNTTLDFTTTISPTITFSNINRTYGDANFNLGATSDSGGTITYSIEGANTTGAVLNGTNNETVALGIVGTLTIRATQAANGGFSSGVKDMTLTITAKALTITGLTADDKIYDGTTAGTASGIAALSGVELGDVVTIGGTPVFTFASKDVGTGITVTSSGFTILGIDAGNYNLTQPTLSANITSILGLEDTLLKSSISLYPNPVNNKLHIKTNNIKLEEATLYNILGKTIKNVKLDHKMVDFSGINSGVYLLKITTDKGTFVERIIKK